MFRDAKAPILKKPVVPMIKKTVNTNQITRKSLDKEKDREKDKEKNKEKNKE